MPKRADLRARVGLDLAVAAAAVRTMADVTAASCDPDVPMSATDLQAIAARLDHYADLVGGAPSLSLRNGEKGGAS